MDVNIDKSGMCCTENLPYCLLSCQYLLTSHLFVSGSVLCGTLIFFWGYFVLNVVVMFYENLFQLPRVFFFAVSVVAVENTGTVAGSHTMGPLSQTQAPQTIIVCVVVVIHVVVAQILSTVSFALPILSISVYFLS